MASFYDYNPMRDPLHQDERRNWETSEEIQRKIAEEVLKKQKEELEMLNKAEHKIYDSLMACEDPQGIKDLTIALETIRKAEREVIK